MKFAAFDELTVYAIGDTPEQAIANARRETWSDEASFYTARVSDELAIIIETAGWNGNRQTFDVRNGELFEARS